jgi:RimJ/RimL family protein N-acetyltransferase
LLSLGSYQTLPIRHEDMSHIMKWRNEQSTALRNNQKLTKKKQDEYFKNNILPTFSQKQPTQMLFSFFFNQKLIGYGGLVHIDWKNQNAEISFLLATDRNKPQQYTKEFMAFLQLIIQVASQTSLKKIYTNGYSNRKYAFKALPLCGFVQEGILKKHKLINGKFYDIIYYAYFLK